jgi:hypothetical protein
MTAILRLVRFEFTLIRVLFFRIIIERLLNTGMAAVTGFGAVYVSSQWADSSADLGAPQFNFFDAQAMILFSFLYAETILANWQYTTNRTGRMELIFNSTQPPLRIIFIKNVVSACVTLASLLAIFTVPLAWFGVLGAFNLSFLFATLATFFVCCCVMSFNAVFEFKVKQVKALTSTLNIVFPYLASRYAPLLPDSFGFLPYFNGGKFLSLQGQYGAGQVVWLFLTAAVTGGVFLLLAQLLVRRIKATASVYLE